MDPRQQHNQPNPHTGVNPPSTDGQALDSQQAADLIRQQIQSIHSGQDLTAAPAPQPQAVSTPQPQAQPQPQPQAQPQPQTPVAAPQPQHYNPYHRATNPIVAANTQLGEINQTVSAPQSIPPEPAQPGGASYRNNYATFAVPGTSQPEPQLPESHEVTAPEAKPLVVNAPGLDPNNPPAQPEPPVSVADLKERVVKRVQDADTKKIHHRLKPLIVSLVIGLLFIGINYNEVAVAQVKQYISPGDSISTPVIIDPTAAVDIGPEPRIIIPKINLDVPVVYGITGYDEAQIQDGLEKGVVHYGSTALPGQKGNNVIVGHSSNNYFNSGEYKFAFVLLFRLEKDDTFILHYKGQRYIYKVFNKQVIEPNNFTLTQPTDKPVTTLITCTPPGTSWKRLVIQAEQISPNPNDAVKSQATGPAPDINTTVPGNAPSLWQRITDSIF